MTSCLCSLLWFLGYFVAIPLGLLKLYIKWTTGWNKSQVCLAGKTVIVTGANTGIGYVTAIDLAKRGARVILACRNEEKAKDARDRIIKETDNLNVMYKLVDFSSLKSVRAFAEDINKTERRLDILVNNAGVYFSENKITEDGFLLAMQSNYYGPFLLTILLLDLLKKTESSRIVNVASVAAKLIKLELDAMNEFDHFRRVYGRTKLCNVLFTIELAKRLRGTKVTTYSLHPGLIMTDIFAPLPEPLRSLFTILGGIVGKNAEEGAQTSIHCAIHRGIEEYSGEHFHDCAVVKRYATAEDPSLARKLWEKTEKDLKLSSKGE